MPVDVSRCVVELLTLNIVMSSRSLLNLDFENSYSLPLLWHSLLPLFSLTQHTHTLSHYILVTCDFSPDKQDVFLRLKFGDVIQILEENGGIHIHTRYQ